MKIKHLFWKIFFAFLLANLLVMATTMFLVVRTWEFERVEQRHKNTVEKISARIINLYEQGKIRRIEALQEGRKDNHGDHRRKVLPLKILDSGGKVVFDNLPQKFRGKDLIQISYESLNGNIYKIISLVGPPPRFLQVLHKINIVQFILMLVASIAASALLGWSITRPLNKLSEYSRYYAAKRQRLPLEETLLQRGDEIGTLARDFNTMIDEVEHSIKMQKQLLHDVSHELRAPLSRLQVAAALLENNRPELHINVERINIECLRIDRLIQEILDFSRLEQSQHEKSIFTLNILVADLIEDLRFQFPDRIINLYENGKELKVNGYEDLFCRAFANIVINACKHTAEHQPVDVRLEQHSEQIHIVVRDHGAGVKEGDLEHLFRFFYRANNNMHAEGFGLGLGIAKRAMEMNNGDIQLRNHTEGGLEVTLIFFPTSRAYN